MKLNYLNLFSSLDEHQCLHKGYELGLLFHVGILIQSFNPGKNENKRITLVTEQIQEYLN